MLKMKKGLALGLAVASCLSIGASAVTTESMFNTEMMKEFSDDDYNSPIALSLENQQFYFEESSKRISQNEDIFKLGKSHQIEDQHISIENNGIVAYSDGTVKQRILTVYEIESAQSSKSRYTSHIGVATDDWYYNGEFIGSVSLGARFDVNGWEAIVDTYAFSYDSEFPGSLTANSSSITEYSSQGNERYANVNARYHAYSEGESQTANLAVRCDRNGKITRSEETEYFN